MVVDSSIFLLIQKSCLWLLEVLVDFFFVTQLF